MPFSFSISFFWIVYGFGYDEGDGFKLGGIGWRRESGVVIEVFD